ncbi:uncharacterized protein LOC142341084 [Convolutriloba macropyga]|uniref:uncharacterized protein LOC142341084 n=1 Tax=Convolutriloba macropyga TaxID=536237 RepID=UPI003F51BF52
MKISIGLVAFCLATLCNGYPRIEVTPMYRAVHSSYTDCGKSSDVFHATGISVSPDTISIPGTITISATISSSANVSAPIKADLDLSAKALGFTIDLCKENIINCTYADVCADLAADDVPICPIPAGSISVKQLTLPIPSIPQLPHLNKLTVNAKAVLSQGDTELGCFEAKVVLHIT